MNDSPAEVAKAFSSHRFTEAFPSLAEGVVWSLVGEDPIVGREDVIRVCRQLGQDLAGTTVRFSRFRVVVGDGTVVVDSVAEYVDGEGARSEVASCDLYDFEAGKVVAVRSFNVET